MPGRDSSVAFSLLRKELVNLRRVTKSHSD